jgi:uncharacterized protein (TIGR04551 family)
MRVAFPTVTAVLALVLAVRTSAAQPAGSGPIPGAISPDEDKKPEGIAEQAPASAILPTTPVLPTPRSHRKRWQLLELDGYYRLRTDWFKNFQLGLSDDPSVGGGPFPQPIACQPGGTGSRPCNDKIKSVNMRLRLMPTINLDEGTSIFAEVDLLDNLVLGSTPTGMALDGSAASQPLAPFGDSQDAPQAGLNSDRDSIAVKRVWAEVAVPLGLIKFGRMPNHWGMGIMANSGGEDPIHGGIDLDSDFGDTVDRLSFSTIIPGTSIRGGIATDYHSNRLVSNQTDAGKRGGQPFDLDDNDDVTQWVLTLSQLNTPLELSDKVARGDAVFNWGIYFAYRKQNWDYSAGSFTVGGAVDGASYVPRDYVSYIPDLWARLSYKNWTFEGEAVGVMGSVERLDEAGFTEPVSIRQFGGVARATYSGMSGRLRMGLEVGAASGDQWDNSPQGSTHISNANLLGGPGDHELTRFVFDRDYKVDLILFRELIGAVTNAAYAKPFLHYDLTKSISVKFANVTSMALKPISTPGNGDLWGMEFDTDLAYTAPSGFSAGLAYGVLFPLSAMNHPYDDPAISGPGFGYGTNAGDADNAHTIQMRLGLTF